MDRGNRDTRLGIVRSGGVFWALVLIAVVFLNACGSSGPAYEEPAADIAAIVEIRDNLTFNPTEITVQVGDRVEWRNKTSMIHTVTADARIVSDPAQVALPLGAEPFNSAALQPDRVFRHRFNVPGTYRYICMPHAGQNMTGTVIVMPGS